MSSLTIFSLDLGNKRTKMYTEKGVKDFPSQYALKKMPDKKLISKIS